MRLITKTFVFALLLGISTSSCDLANQVNQLANLARCQYRLANLSNLSLAGVPLAGITTMSSLTASNILTLGLAYATNSMNLGMNLNVDVKNGQKDTAALNQLDYQLAVETTKLTEGTFPKTFKVTPGTTGTLAIPINVNLSTLTGKSQTDLINLALNLSGQSADPSTVALRIRPYFTVGGQTLKFPNFFTVKTTFGGDSL